MHGTVRYRVQIVFLDAAGTLIRLRQPVGQSYGECAAGFGFQAGRDPETWRELERSFAAALQAKGPLAFPGQGPNIIPDLERHWWKDVVRQTFEPMALFPRWEECFERLYDFFSTADAWKLEVGCRDTLSRLIDNGLSIGLLSNFDSRIDSLLQQLDIRSFFSHLTISSRVGAAKPDLAIFRHALQKTGFEAAQALHVGDSLEKDFKGAQRAGMQALLYDPWKRALGSLDKRRIERLTELSRLLL